MTVKQLLSYFGNRREAAYRTGYTESGIKVWEKNDRIPLKAQKMVEGLTGGALKADKK